MRVELEAVPGDNAQAKGGAVPVQASWSQIRLPRCMFHEQPGSRNVLQSSHAV